MAEQKVTTTTTKLNPAIFAVAVENHELLKLAYDTYLANSRSAKAKTLKRGEVRGGGKKPWRQKGTGRARFGSSRNPIWRGGGIAFGPTGDQNYTKKLPKTMKKLAIRQALSLASLDKKIIPIDTFACPEGKVKETIALLNEHKINKTSGVLLVVPTKDELVLRATRNVAGLKVIRPTYLNVFDILNADKILISKKALSLVESWLLEEDN
jgi:large subunit ribosomal protein L4